MADLMPQTMLSKVLPGTYIGLPPSMSLAILPTYVCSICTWPLQVAGFLQLLVTVVPAMGHMLLFTQHKELQRHHV
jgi:hypothetical protein